MLCSLLVFGMMLLTVGCKRAEENHPEMTEGETEITTISDENNDRFPEEIQQNGSSKKEDSAGMLTTASDSMDVTSDMSQKPMEYGTAGVSEEIITETARKDAQAETRFDSDNAAEKQPPTPERTTESVTTESAGAGNASKPYEIELPDIYF